MPALLDLLLPQRCAACSAVAPRGLCGPCAGAAAHLRLPTGALTVLTPRVAALGVFAYDGVVRDAVRGMKLGGRHRAARPLGELLRAHPGRPPEWPVTYVPSSRRRLRERGVELTRLLAGPDAVALLERTADGPDQTSLDADARRRSPVGAFRAVAAPPPDVVLVDDVRTTGATATAAATALLDGGAARVLVLTLAVGGDDARTPAVAPR